MKKLTKKAIAAAPKYMVAIDWNASYSGTIDRKTIEASDIFEAMQIADKLFSENVYLLRIKEKTGEVREGEFLVYEDRLVSRTAGNWHLADEAHYETALEALYNVEFGFTC